jgi:hypothetical protein
MYEHCSSDSTSTCTVLQNKVLLYKSNALLKHYYSLINEYSRVRVFDL